MLEIYSINPSLITNIDDLECLCDEFGYHNSRLIACLPSQLINILENRIFNIEPGLYDPCDESEREVFISKIKQYCSVNLHMHENASSDSCTIWQDETTLWSNNKYINVVLDVINNNSIKLQKRLREYKKNDTVYVSSAEYFKYVDELINYFRFGKEIVIVDPFFYSKDHFNLLRKFASNQKFQDSEIEKIVVNVKLSKFTESNKNVSNIGEYIESCINNFFNKTNTNNYILYPKYPYKGKAFKMIYRFIFDRNFIKEYFHDRFVFNNYGGVKLGHGFQIDSDIKNSTQVELNTMTEKSFRRQSLLFGACDNSKCVTYSDTYEFEIGKK